MSANYFLPDAFLRRLRALLAEPRLAGIDLESGARIAAHRRLLQEKKLIRDIFVEMYRFCAALDERWFSGAGARVELGAGASLIKDYFPEVITTDIMPARHLSLVLNAAAMPLAPASVRAFYAIDCFHHLPAPESFFQELRRCLAPGGGAVMIEPYYGPLARWLYGKLFATERFDPRQKEWSAPAETMGAMRGANQALSYIVFTRDRKMFEERFPELRIVASEPLGSYVRYLASGGLNFRPLAPAVLGPALRACETALKPLRRVLALHHVIVLRKEAR